MKIMGFQCYIPTTLLFGCGMLNKLHKQRLPGKKALVVISNGKSVRTSGALDRVIDQLAQAGVTCEVFSGVMPNPTEANVMDGAAAGRAAGCDFVVGLGGGSSIDAAKAIAVMMTNEGTYWDYLFSGTGGRRKMKNKPAPVIAIPTTAGTGTETDPWMVVTKPETQEKIGGGTVRSFPVIALVDPELMASVPPKLTAFQGFDALFHGIECYLSKVGTPMSDIYALETVRAVGPWLAAACADGQNMEAREKVAWGSTLAGYAMSLSSNGSEHAMEHAMSAFQPSLPHGAGLIMISRAYHTHLAQHVPELADKLVTLAKAMGRAEAHEPMDFVQALVDLQRACGVEDLKMSDYGLKAEEIPAMEKNARETMGMLFAADAFTLTTEDCIAIYQQSYR